jgi:acyl dehydratase
MDTNISLHQEFTHNFRFNQDDINLFAKVTGDNNPVHTDEAYAAKTIFGKRVMHGMLGAAVFSRVFGTLFPGEGTIYLKQDLKFLKPMFVDTDYRVVFKVEELFPEKHRARVSTNIVEVASGAVCTTGEAMVMNPGKIK